MKNRRACEHMLGEMGLDHERAVEWKNVSDKQWVTRNRSIRPWK